MCFGAPHKLRRLIVLLRWCDRSNRGISHIYRTWLTIIDTPKIKMSIKRWIRFARDKYVEFAIRCSDASTFGLKWFFANTANRHFRVCGGTVVACAIQIHSLRTTGTIDWTEVLRFGANHKTNKRNMDCGRHTLPRHSLRLKNTCLFARSVAHRDLWREYMNIYLRISVGAYMLFCWLRRPYHTLSTFIINLIYRTVISGNVRPVQLLFAYIANVPLNKCIAYGPA